eukprot:3613791-Pyramimonas_sp.AAC.1
MKRRKRAGECKNATRTARRRRDGASTTTRRVGAFAFRSAFSTDHRFERQGLRWIPACDPLAC